MDVILKDRMHYDDSEDSSQEHARALLKFTQDKGSMDDFELPDALPEEPQPPKPKGPLQMQRKRPMVQKPAPVAKPPPPVDLFTSFVQSVVAKSCFGKAAKPDDPKVMIPQSEERAAIFRKDVHQPLMLRLGTATKEKMTAGSPEANFHSALSLDPDLTVDGLEMTLGKSGITYVASSPAQANFFMALHNIYYLDGYITATIYDCYKKEDFKGKNIQQIWEMLVSEKCRSLPPSKWHAETTDTLFSPFMDHIGCLAKTLENMQK